MVMLKCRIMLWRNRHADTSPYPSERNDSAMLGCACAGPFPVAIMVLFTATTHPNVDIPKCGLCPPSDAISKWELGLIRCCTAVSCIRVVIMPMMCSRCSGERWNQTLFFSFLFFVRSVDIFDVLMNCVSRRITLTGSAYGGSSVAVVVGVAVKVMVFRCSDIRGCPV
jgi:hypothetical protein